MSDNDTPILGPVHHPTTIYTPRTTTALCEATKDMLLFLRVEGIRCEHLEVTDKGVLLHAIVDDYPSKRQASATAPVRAPSYMDQGPDNE